MFCESFSFFVLRQKMKNFAAKLWNVCERDFKKIFFLLFSWKQFFLENRRVACFSFVVYLISEFPSNEL